MTDAITEIPNAQGTHGIFPSRHTLDGVYCNSEFRIPLPNDGRDVKDPTKYGALHTCIDAQTMAVRWQVLVNGNMDLCATDYKGKYSMACSYNSEEGVTLGEMIAGDRDHLIVFNLERIEAAVKAGEGTQIGNVKVPVLDGRKGSPYTLYIPVPKSPHGVNVDPTGRYAVCAGKLSPTVSVVDLDKVEDAFAGKIKPRDCVVAEPEVGLGPLHTAFDHRGNAYTSIFIDSVVTQWNIADAVAGRNPVKQKLDVHYQIGHINASMSETKDADGNWVIALNKFSKDRFLPVGSFRNENDQLIDISSGSMRLEHDASTHPEPHDAVIVKRELLRPHKVWDPNDPRFDWERKLAARFGLELGADSKVVREGNHIYVFMIGVAPTFSLTEFEVKQGDTVTLALTNKDGVEDLAHGLCISHHDINFGVSPQETASVTFEAKQKGVFWYYCPWFCHALHLEMRSHDCDLIRRRRARWAHVGAPGAYRCSDVQIQGLYGRRALRPNWATPHRAETCFTHLLGLALMMAFAVLVRPIGATELILRDGRPFCRAYACGTFLPEAEAFRASDATTLPVIEALRDNKVYAYLFLSTDLVDIPAYSGKPLVTLVAIDPKGIVIKAAVVHHNEPILLVGLPESILNDYLSQYIGRSMLDRFEIVSGGIQDVSPDDRRDRQAGRKPGEPVGIHMITGATVTALVLEETLLTSTRQVGHALGLIAADDQRTVTWKADYVPKSWPALVREGSIGHLRVEARDMEPDHPGEEPWIDLYFGDLTPPVVGVNILGKSGYNWLRQQLQPGEKAIFVVANGISSFKGSGFVRGGIFDRFHLEQGLKSYSFKDLDYENLYGIKSEAAPRFKESGIFFLRDTGFDSTRPWQFVFLTYRLTGETATSKAFKTFSQTYRLPNIYYDVQEPSASRPTSLVERIWQERLYEVIALSLLLAATMAIFFSRRWLTAKAKRLEVVHVLVLVAAIAIIGLWLKTPPSVTQLFPFVRLFDEGIRFELFLADPLLFVFWLFIVVSLILWGRGWFCGWICPYGALLELLYKLSSACLPRHMLFEFSQRTHDRLRFVRYAILAGLMVMAVLSLEWAERLAD